ncbi:MAG: hypothetical protein RL410_253 [Actinomycetota bacterium]|jgi:tetratricopeptide (TPR) repeat protein
MEENFEGFNTSDFNPYIASEKQCWEMLPHLRDEEKAHTLIALGRHAYHRDEFETAATFADQAASLWDNAGDKREQARALYNAGCSYRKEDNKSEAIDRFRQSVAIASEVADHLGAATTCYELAKVLGEAGHDAEARKCFQDGLAFSKSAEDPSAVADSLENYAGYLRDQGMFDQADALLTRDVPSLVGLASPGEIASLYAIWADVKNLNHDSVDALEYIVDSHEYAVAMGLKHETVCRQITRAKVERDIGLLDDAVTHLKDAVVRAMAMKDAALHLHAGVALANLYIERAEFAEALEASQALMSLCRLSSNHSALCDLVRNVSHASTMLGDEVRGCLSRDEYFGLLKDNDLGELEQHHQEQWKVLDALYRAAHYMSEQPYEMKVKFDDAYISEYSFAPVIDYLLQLKDGDREYTDVEIDCAINLCKLDLYRAQHQLEIKGLSNAHLLPDSLFDSGWLSTTEDRFAQLHLFKGIMGANSVDCESLARALVKFIQVGDRGAAQKAALLAFDAMEFAAEGRLL